MGFTDEDAVQELNLFTANDADIYRQQTESIFKNLITKMARGQYRHDLAVKLFMYLAETGAKKYAREHGDGREWHKMFPVDVRRAVSEQWAGEFEVEAKLGNYDRLLPKKYQKK